MNEPAPTRQQRDIIDNLNKTLDSFNPTQLPYSEDVGTHAPPGRRKNPRALIVAASRVHPDPAYRLQTAVLELKEDREVYLVSPSLWPELASEPTFSPRLLIATMNRQGILFLWPIRLPGADGKIDDWSRSALDAAGEAESRWTRMMANMSLQAYDIIVAPGQVAKPVWPDLTFQQIIRIAFRDRMIDTLDHPVLRRLREGA